mmetsp:Transcript_20346/g.52526  ORF Transcript_20346/g.52526 Transcript_20346/m.52526 type:complete len:260 (-) Transcript_20346:165-944(-)
MYREVCMRWRRKRALATSTSCDARRAGDVPSLSHWGCAMCCLGGVRIPAEGGRWAERPLASRLSRSCIGAAGGEAGGRAAARANRALLAAPLHPRRQCAKRMRVSSAPEAPCMYSALARIHIRWRAICTSSSDEITLPCMCSASCEYSLRRWISCALQWVAASSQSIAFLRYAAFTVLCHSVSAPRMGVVCRKPHQKSTMWLAPLWKRRKRAARMVPSTLCSTWCSCARTTKLSRCAVRWRHASYTFATASTPVAMAHA